VNDGASVVSGSRDGVIRHHAANEAVERRLFEVGTAVNALAWSARTGTLAAGCKDGVIRLFDLERMEPTGELRSTTAEVFGLAWSPDGINLASAAYDGAAYLWRVLVRPRGGRLLRLFPAQVRGSANPLIALTWSPDGRYFAAAGVAGRIFVWEPERDDTPMQWAGHTGLVTSLAYSPDGRFLASKSQDNTVRLWWADTGEQALQITEPVSRTYLTSLAFHPTQPLLATLGARDRIIRVWRLHPPTDKGHAARTRKRPRRKKGRAK
jgi:WD40 repeat protein